MNSPEYKELLDQLARVTKERDLYYKRGVELAQKKLQSDSVSELSAAFSHAQGEFSPIVKHSQGYNYKYAPLETIIASIRPVLSKHGLSISQFTDENSILYTRLRHSSGEWIESRIKLREPEGDNKRSIEQAYGAVQTYMRRYQLLALLGIQPAGEDTIE